MVTRRVSEESRGLPLFLTYAFEVALFLAAKSWQHVAAGVRPKIKCQLATKDAQRSETIAGPKATGAAKPISKSQDPSW